jgi:two-component system, NtrC family, nitrogen regulation sensor histidine kinase NtrY
MLIKFSQFLRSFSIQVTLRVLGLLLCLITLAFIFARTELFFTQLILLLLLAFQVYDLIRLVNRTNQDLSRFLLAIRYGDFSVHFTDPNALPTTFRHLHYSFGEMMDSYKKMESQKESQFLFFKRIIEGVNTGIIALSAEGKMVLVNQAAQHLLQMPGLSSWTELQNRQPAFVQAIEGMKGRGRSLVEMRLEGETRQLALGIDPIVLLGESHQIITFQDIRSEIEQKEIEAWHKLIRILTHEIMNSVTPVVSLTDTMLMMLEDGELHATTPAGLTEENLDDLRLSLQTIRKRSQGMLHFVNDYRQLTHLSVPQPERLNVAALLSHAGQLMQGEFQNRNIQLHTQISDPDLIIEGDAKLIEQVLINLMTNGMQALEERTDPKMELSAYSAEGRVVIEVSDNGKGIDADKLDKIFVPFYSTKANGSGIGLSLSRQIMQLHGGTIGVQSEKGIKTTFELRFPK